MLNDASCLCTPFLRSCPFVCLFLDIVARTLIRVHVDRSMKRGTMAVSIVPLLSKIVSNASEDRFTEPASHSTAFGLWPKNVKHLQPSSIGRRFAPYIRSPKQVTLVGYVPLCTFTYLYLAMLGQRALKISSDMTARARPRASLVLLIAMHGLVSSVVRP